MKPFGWGLKIALSTMLVCIFITSAIFGQPISAQSQSASQEKVEKKNALPKGFVYLDEVIPSAQYDIRYYGDYNFVGKRIDGYNAPLAIMSLKGATALKKVSDELDKKGYLLIIYDAYRPQKGVNHFVKWSQDAKDIKMKTVFYPLLDKRNLFKLGFIATKSGHTRGSTVDLSIVHKSTGKIVDMGGPFDFFGDISNHGTKLITKQQTGTEICLRMQW